MALLDLSGKLALISLETPGAFIFELFPKEIQTVDRGNWEPQDVTRGRKPLMYANTEPRRISVPEIIIDGARTNQTINDHLDQLRALMNERPETGAPPALLLVYGDRDQRCVLEEVTVVENFFNGPGDPLRARVSLQLVELQEESEVVTSTVTPVDNPIGNF